MEAVFYPQYPISTIVPAEYNPRFLSEDAFARLRQSIAEVGFVKPIIVNTNGTIIAGHQRTRAAGSLGITHVPAVVLTRTASLASEFTFNLSHNRLEAFLGGHVEGPLPPPGTWGEVKPTQVKRGERAGASVVKEACTLIAKYGRWGAVLIAEGTGEILNNGDYADACVAMALPVRVFVLEAARVAAAKAHINGEYGVYDFSRVDMAAEAQTFAQPHRLRKGTRHLQSDLYKCYVLPHLGEARETRVVDFGAGQADHIRELMGLGFDAHYYEPFIRVKGNRDGLDLKEISRRIADLTRDVKAKGLYDVVVCDHVLNSVQNETVYAKVIATLWSLCKGTGTVYIASRAKKTGTAESKGAGSFSRTFHGTIGGLQYLPVMDGDVLLRVGRGHVRKQFLLGQEDFLELFPPFFAGVENLGQGVTGNRARLTLPKRLPRAYVRACFEAEFNFEYPGGVRLEKWEPLWRLVEARLDAEGRLHDDAFEQVSIERDNADEDAPEDAE